jgi:hypothetical protein
VKIVDKRENGLQNKKVFLITVLWWSFQIEEETWERESEMRRKYLKLFLNIRMFLNFENEIFIRNEESKPWIKFILKTTEDIM